MICIFGYFDLWQKKSRPIKICLLERKTRLELATLTLARLCSTNWATSACHLFVPRAGLEPARPQWSQDFKSCVSTNSTTKASFKERLFEGAKIQLFSISYLHFWKKNKKNSFMTKLERLKTKVQFIKISLWISSTTFYFCSKRF